jgi:hypothetical protein
MKLLVHASGYTVTFWHHNEREEIRSIVHPRCGGTSDTRHWSPSTTDFAAVGRQSGGSSPAATLDELLGVISGQGVESIDELRILGHANSAVFSLAGEVRVDDVYFTRDESVIGDLDPFRKAMPKFRDLQDRFKADAQVVLLGCNSGGTGNPQLLSLVSHAFLRKAAGFQNEITYRLRWAPTGPAVKDGNKVVCNRLAANSRVTERGQMLYMTAAMSQMAAVVGDDPASMAGMFQGNAWNLQPDVSADDGDVLAAVRRKDVSTGAQELMWRLLGEFYPGHAWVSGSSFDQSLSGLRVRWNDPTHGFIDVGPNFARQTTPRTLKNRVAELGKALDLIGQKKQGVIPLT